MNNLTELAIQGHKINAISKGTNFDIRISKSEAERLLGEAVFEIMCKEYGDGKEWIGLCTDDLDEEGKLDEDYKTFEIWLDQRFDYSKELNLLTNNQ